MDGTYTEHIDGTYTLHIDGKVIGPIPAGWNLKSARASGLSGDAWFCYNATDHLIGMGNSAETALADAIASEGGTDPAFTGAPNG